MKKLIYILVFFIAFSKVNATTYYWIGGASDTSFVKQKSWTTDPIGRAAVGATGSITVGLTDVFIFDGTNIGGLPAVTGAVSITMSSLTATPFAQLKFINGANVSLGRTTAGSSVINIVGDGTTSPDLVVDATSTLTIGSLSSDCNVQILLDSTKGGTGLISGKLYISPLSKQVHTRSYITSKLTGALVFATGSQCYITDSTATSGFNASHDNCVVFQSGASMYYYSGRSPIGSSTSIQMTDFKPGSNLYFEGSNVSYVDGITAYTTSSWTNGKFLANVFIQNGATVTADGAVGKIENLTIDAGCNFVLYKSGQTPVLGNLTVNGALKCVSPSTNTVVMGGNTPQTIAGTGTINIPSFAVADNSSVTLGQTIKDSFSNTIAGKIDFGATGVITGPSTFNAKVGTTAAALTGNTTAGSYQITGVVGTISGVTGVTINGTGIPVNTNVLGYSTTGAIINMSQPATATATGVALTFTDAAAVLATANPNGFDSSTGSVTVTGLKSYTSGISYIINAATSHPFGVSSGSTTGLVSVNNVTINANVTGNINTKVTGTLTLNTGKYTIRPSDTLRIASGKDIAGGIFSAAKYIVTDINGANVGVLRIDSFSTTKLFPIGTATNFLPVTFSPADSASFEASAFTGVTTNASPTGTAFSPTAKSTIVDAVWRIHRSLGTGNVSMGVNWPQNLEGSMFTNFANSQIGIAKYDTTLGWTKAIDSLASNTLNTAVATFSGFTSFSVGQIGVALPVRLINFAASLKSNNADIFWQVENEKNIDHFIVEKSINGTQFSTEGTVKALNNAASVNSYSFNDPAAFSTSNYYRIKIVGLDGSVKYSNILLVKNSPLLNVLAYPNPVKAQQVVTVAFNAAVTAEVIINVVDMNGKIVSATKSNISSGANTISIETGNNMKPGNYIISINVNNNQDAAIHVPVIVK